MLHASTLHKLWSLIEKTSTQTLLNKTDKELALYLLTQLENKQILNLQDYESVLNYIYSKITLIRDLADSRELVTL
ncbi:MAG: hypothetical protein QNJ54_37285 [Prochloraceae cyanobacterium]|nr:hypothetical protein [Prochloraceae cyanobacterium]